MRERDVLALVGTVLQDSYRLTRLVGAGGMGAVFEAEHLRLNTKVAVKVMVRELAANDEALARFRREAEVTSRIGHPHIVHVSDFGTIPSGEPYMVMEFLEGEDLDHRIRRQGRCSLLETISVVKQVASALAASHSKGVVHRDLKPANLFLLEIEGETSFVKVVDFGISKVRAATTKLTGSSVVMGTPNYMSPEQAMGRVDEIDHRTDQWSLACIAYEMLTGRGPFVGENAASLLYQVIHQEPPPMARRAPDVPNGVEQVLLRALSKDMARRYETVTAFSRALEAAAAETRSVVDSAAPVASGSTSRGDAGPRPTTFSQAASELVVATRASRVTARRLVVTVGAVIVVGVGILWFARPPSSPATPSNAAAQRPAPPSPSSPPPAVAPIAPPPPPPIVTPPPPPAPADVSREVPSVPARRTSAERRAAPSKATTAAKPPAWVDPFAADAPTSAKPAAKGARPGGKPQPEPAVQETTPAKPKRRIIEDL